MRRFEVGSKQLEEAEKKVRDAIKAKTRPIRSVSDLVRSMKKEIAEMRKRGDSWEEIRRILSDSGITVSRAALARNAPAVLEEGPARPRKSGKQTQKEGKEIEANIRGKASQAGMGNVIERVGESKADEASRSGVGTFRIRPDRDDL